MPEKEATARIKINKLLEAAGWRFFPDPRQPALHVPEGRYQAYDEEDTVDTRVYCFIRSYAVGLDRTRAANDRPA